MPFFFSSICNSLLMQFARVLYGFFPPPSNQLSLWFYKFSFLIICFNDYMFSYWYNFDANNWSAVYKHTYGKDLKFKAGYDSEVRLGWASLWVGAPLFLCLFIVGSSVIIFGC